MTEGYTSFEERFYELLGAGTCLVCNQKLKDHKSSLACAEVNGRKLVVKPGPQDDVGGMNEL